VSSPATELVNTTTGPFLVDPLANELLGQFQGRKNVNLKRLADEIDRNFTDWTVFADRGVAEKNVNVPFQRVGHVIGMKEVQLLDAEIVQPERFYFLPQAGYLRQI
jgi:hypothetical protein